MTRLFASRPILSAGSAVLAAACLAIAVTPIATLRAIDRHPERGFAVPLGVSEAARALFERPDAGARDHSEEARRGLLASPLVPGALTHLAQRAGTNSDLRATLLESAGKLSRRDLSTQVEIYADAVGKGDYPRALVRAEALLRSSQGEAVYFDDFVARLSEPGFRPALLSALTSDPTAQWPLRFLFLRAKVLPPDLALAFVAERERRGAPVDREQIAALSAALLNAKQEAAGFFLAQTHLVETGYPQRLEWISAADARGAGPLGWYIAPGYAVGEHSDGARLERTDPTATRPVARILTLAPGTYRISAGDAPARNAMGGPTWRWNLGCGTRPSPAVLPSDVPVTIASHCKRQMLSIAFSAGVDSDFSLGPIRLERSE